MMIVDDFWMEHKGKFWFGEIVCEHGFQADFELKFHPDGEMDLWFTDAHPEFCLTVEDVKEFARAERLKTLEAGNEV